MIPEQTAMYWALRKQRYSRQEHIRQIEDLTGRRLLVYFSTDAGAISSDDIIGFADLLEKLEAKERDLDLLVQTSGGDIEAAERIVYMCREKANTLRVIIAERAKSAVTLIALAADSVVMGYTSALGPIDPQVMVSQTGEVLPAHSYLDGLEYLAGVIGLADPEQSVVYMPLLEKLSPQLLDYCRKAIQRSEEFAAKWLSKHMLKEKEAKCIAKKLCDPKRYKLHGTVIDHKEAKKMGLNVEYLPPDDEIWRAIWVLFCMYKVDAEKHGDAKIFESSTVSLAWGPREVAL